MKLLRTLLFPVVPIYFLVTWLRNKLYDMGWKSSTSFDLPVICVGNLSVGGTGKTPMIEYLIRSFKNDYKIAVLSRGYKRNTKGFQLADKNATPETLGDEPYQFFRKYKDISVAVDSNRRHGIDTLRNMIQPEVILLDDAFQHRKVTPGFNVLLTAYDALYSEDFVLPTGNLREPRSGAKRADVIVITKCPHDLTETERSSVIQKLKPLPHQSVFFSAIQYSKTFNSQNGSMGMKALKNTGFTLVTGIANPKPLVAYLRSEGFQFEHLQFKDHHQFNEAEIRNLKTRSMIVTTEKDYVRLLPSFKDLNNLYYLPIEFGIENSKGFEKQIRDFLSSF
ncbi:MAG: tetraacyldisaccharide 4'-kinase [Psychroserpens sp.]|nr:tetraacyldisaccharide 4'-kinase [Psychroserpens sp.]